MKKILSLLLLLPLCLSAFAKGDIAAVAAIDEGEYTLQCVVSPQYAGNVNYSKAQAVTAGKEYYLTANARTGFKFVSWKDENGKVVSEKNYFYYTMPERNVVLTAQFEYSPETPADPTAPEVKNTHKLMAKVFPPYSGTTNIKAGGEDYEVGKEVYLYANNRTGFQFIDWRDETGQVVSDNDYFYYNMPDRDVTLTAYFEYSPTTPVNPQRNFYDSETKTLIMDDFITNRLYDTANGYMNQNGLKKEDILTLVVIGQVNNTDVSNTGYLATNTIDLGRTTGLSRFTDISNAVKLTSLKLPESVTEISYYAFSNMKELMSLTLYAYEPPTVDERLISHLDKDKVNIFVPGAALGLYTTHEVWGKYVVMPIADDVRDVTISLPSSVSPSDYENCYIDLVNAKSGQRVTYLVQDAMSYTFYSILKNTTWNAYLRTADGMVLGEINGIEVKDENVSCTFGTLKRLHTLKVAVTSTDGKNLDDEATIQWLTAAGDFIAQGPELAGQPDGRQLVVRVSLANYIYAPIADVSITVGTDGDNVAITAAKRETINVQVKVADGDGKAIPGAVVVLTQDFGKKYSTPSAVTDAKGIATINAMKGFDASVTAQAKSYISQTANVSASALESPVLLTLAKLAGTKIHMAATATLAVPEGTTPKVIKAEGLYALVFEFLNYELKNKSTGAPISTFGRTGDTIDLADALSEGTQVEVTASLPGTIPMDGQNIEVEPVSGTGTVSGGKAEVAMSFVQRGGLTATISSENDIPTMLFAADGTLFQQKTFKKGSVSFLNLPEGDYTLVTMMRSGMTTTIGSLSSLDDLGLEAGLDYAISTKTVKRGIISSMAPVRYAPRSVPEPDYLDAYTSFTVNKSEVVIGNFITLSTLLRFSDEVAADVSDVTVVYDLQPQNSYVPNSCIIGSDLTPVTYSSNQLTVPVSSTATSRIRFCTVPNVTGTYTPMAYVKFKYKGSAKTVAIGSVSFDAKSLDINVQHYTADGTVSVSGMAPPLSTVEVYDGDVYVGCTTVLADGSWSLRASLTGGEGTHYIHAEVSRIATAPGARLITETKETLWDSSMIMPLACGFQFYNKWLRKTVSISHDLLACTASEKSYMFYTEAEFTFWARLTAHGADKLEQVIINIFLESGDVLSLTAYYDTVTDLYVTTHTFGWGDLPTAMSVDWVLKGETRIVIDHTFVPMPPCVEYRYRPIHDPSGYVYEAVGSNRLEGVTATALYKEQYEDMYGDQQERVVVWEAEDYGQVNPQLTNAEGVYHWDVPQGLWQVKLEKPGYETTYSEWLPVPPPQMEVNLPMQQLVPPTVKNVRAYDDMVEMEFSLFMDTHTLTTDSIHITLDGQPVKGAIELLDTEASPIADGNSYASRLRFTPSEDGALSGQGTLAVIVSRQVKGYNGLIMGQAYQQTLKAVKRPKSIEVADTVIFISGAEKLLDIAVLPAAAAAGKKVNVTIASEDMAMAKATELTLDAEGKAQLTVSAALPGTTSISWQIADSSLGAETVVIVRPPVVGDINADGVADVADIACIISVMAGTDEYRNSDVNGDGAVDVADIATIIDEMAARARKQNEIEK